MRDYDLTFSLALQHLEQLLDALVPGLQRLLLGLDARLELLEGKEGREDVCRIGAAHTSRPDKNEETM